MYGLVLTAGGARGAYQAGVLKRIGEIRALRDQPSPFAIIAGASAGAINGAAMAARSDGFFEATRLLAKLWSELKVHDVFRADALSLGANGMRLLRDLTLGGAIGHAGVQALLDATPLRAFLAPHLPLEGIGHAIHAGHLYALAVSATSYHSGRSFTFVQGRAGHPVWVKSRRVTQSVTLTLDHILASAAIPIVFQPVRVRVGDRELYFGDGGLRLVTPLSPAIRLGATHVLAIAIRCQGAADGLWRAEVPADDRAHAMPTAQPPLAQICGVFMNAIFLDHLDADIDHLKRMNELIQAYGSVGAPAPEAAVSATVKEPMRIVTPLVINPSEDLAIVAKQCAHRMPRLVRYLMDGLGTPDAQSADLMSYLLFDSTYTSALVDIGYRDANARIDEIEAFLVPGARRRPLARAPRKAALGS
jgi:NTE family protein